MTPSKRKLAKCVDEMEHAITMPRGQQPAGRDDVIVDRSTLRWALRMAKAAVAWTGGCRWNEGDAVSQEGADKLNALIAAVEDKP